MKIQCNACEAAEAKVLCCADEAALCWECDEKVHAANKLAGKHQRVLLLSASSSSSSSSRIPKCDICQDASGYFFCLEDRALLCRNCDVAVHTVNPCVSAHQRFLLTGIQVGLDSTVPALSESKEQSAKGASERSPKPSKSNPSPISYSGEVNEAFSSQVNKEGSTGTLRAFFGGVSMAGTVTDWTLDEFFRFTDFSQNYGYTDNGSSKADSGKFGSSESSLLSRSFDEDMGPEDCMGQVPEIPSPPTATGLHWPKNSDYVASEFAAFVPDISMQNRTAPTKRRRLWHG
ncbi:putative salt tolerance-like protein [Apostasia shenzhenica]|uniref:Putative salt tolerance-like protein n=1 Tax=Apostasia shenzhenica TaxID=1088818 RepID=A0A2I0B9Z0_9ASPA|nr:putative salt tolerance-like protein [Apostasia shenzhenica]